MLRPYRGTTVPARPRRWALARVHGASMRPTLQEADLLLLDRHAGVRPGSVVVVRLPDGTTAVKRAVHRDPAGWWVERDNPRAGVDSWSLGAVPDRDVLGVVRARLWPRPTAL